MGVQSDHGLSDEEVSHVIGMAWKDDVPFEAIKARYGLDEEAVIALMRDRLKRSSWTLWRERVSGRPSKHASRRSLTDSVSKRPPGARSLDSFEQESSRSGSPRPSSVQDRPGDPGDASGRSETNPEE
ncbi:TIGR03643 family protein [Salinibacter altiplanensis]|uniref:TIGR03643 family protein n=1 Tax=Salinibacter altiplanensis TaxID=1803181 RepID=UPI001E376E5B|nr:TIGR03643 family protein [Salinibacter altiplanensis]